MVTLENIAKKLSMEEIHARMLREEPRHNSSEQNKASVNLLQCEYGNKKIGFPFKCHYCHKKGDKITDCRKRKRDQENPQNSEKR